MEINVVPQITIVSNATKCPAVFLCPILLLTVLFSVKKYVTVDARGKPDKPGKIIGKMALV